MTGIDDLSPHDQLLHAIGAVAQAHVHLEQQMRLLYTALASPGLGVYAPPTSVSTLADACTAMLERADTTERIRESGKLALAACKAANERRNRVVHDRWMLEPDEGHLRRLRSIPYSLNAFKATSETIDDVRAAHEALRRCTVRVFGLTFALFGTMRVHASPVDNPRTVNDSIAMTEDRFTLQPDGGIRTIDG